MGRLRGSVTDNPVGWGIALIAALLILSAPSILPSYYLSAASRIVIIGAFAVAFNVVFGMGGMPSLGHAAFFGAGGYVVGLGLSRWSWGLGTILLVTIVVGALMGLLFGLMSQRVEGIYLLLMTLALAQAVWGMAFQMVNVTRGDMGITGLTTAVIPAVDSRGSVHYMAVVVCVVVVALLWGFMQSPVGRAIIGMRESPSRMRSLGYNVASYKVVAFFVSGLASTLLGAMYAFQQGFVGVDNLDWSLSATVLLAAILGGARHFLGPALGVALLITAETVIGLYTARWMSALGVIYILTILALPEGALGFRVRRRRDLGHGEPLVDEVEPAAAAGAAQPRHEDDVAGRVRP